MLTSRALLAPVLLLVIPFSMASGVPGLELGMEIPAFKLPGVDGKQHSLEDYRHAKVLVIVFTCNHCPTAQAYEERIQKLATDFAKRGVQVVAISPNDDKAVRLDELGYSDLGDSLEEMKIRAKERGFDFPYLYDGENQEFSRKLGVKATPHVFIFDSARRLRYNGRIDDAEVGDVKSHDARNAIEDLLASRDVRVPTTRVFGCSTKWREKRRSVSEADKRWAKQPVSLKRIDAAGIRKLAANEGGDYLLVNVWATWCGPCVTEFPELVKMQRMYRRRHFKLVTISIDNPEDEDDVRKFLQKEHAAMTNYLYGHEDKDKLAEAIDPKWGGPIPYTVLIAPRGDVVYRKEGAFDPLEVRRAVVDRLGRTYASRKRKKR